MKRQTHWTVGEMPWKRKKRIKLRWAEFQHHIRSLLTEEKIYNKYPKREMETEEWLDWLIKAYKERNKEYLNE
jgi:hypothetical protein